MCHANTATQEKSSNFPRQSPRPIVSDPSLPSIIIADPPPHHPFHNCSHPFQVAGSWGPKRRFCLPTSGLITREAATSEHCVESRRHTGKESALYLGSSNNNLPPTSTSLLPNTSDLCKAYAVGTPGLNGEEEKEESKYSCSLNEHHRACSRRLSNMMPDVKLYASTSTFREK